ncbi:pyridoxal phosphate-dependent decarboxylase family protein [Streptomyces johnsoniae]|uniref:Pyridoxal-dependent decarboxylase n=1 Tax=Streptomyces johnsoniae TaxID=3075532 RepID=A0ABU2SFH8_9ACTN|nr:pyridoxal-dependent decarboxylase [Streptomyces sp. DSM 41886]MDT0446520.1 pyridoxal-dependent decarboxylase [Streptomyces sp. DSM 41886]
MTPGPGSRGPEAEAHLPYRPGELALSPEEMRRAGQRAVDLVVERLRGVADGRPHAVATSAELAALADRPLPEEPGDLTGLLEWAAREVLPTGVRFDHPRCFAFVPTTGNFPAVLADALASAFLSVPGAWLVGAGPTRIELTTLAWLVELLGLPPTHGGLFVSGGSVANLTALTAARDHRLGGDLARARLYCSSQAHPSIARAAHIIGLRRDQVVALTPGPGGGLDPRAVRARATADLAAALRPFAVVATVGTTGTGAVDPLPELAVVCREFRLWLHADGAHGAAAALTARGRSACRGLETADSLTIDPHKWLFQPYEAGCLLVRDPALLKATFRMGRHRLDSGYLSPARATGEQINLDDYGPQQSRGLRAFKLWLSLSTFGAAAFRRAVDHGLDLAEYAGARIEAERDLELVTPPSLGILTFRYRGGRSPADGAHDQERISAAVCRTGRAMVLTTEVNGARVLRLCTINPASTRADIDETLGLVLNAGRGR